MAQTTSSPTLTDLLFDKAADGLCLVAPDGTILRVNAEWLRSTGFTEGQVLGEDAIELFPDVRDAALALHARARAGHRVEVPRHAQLVGGREKWLEGSIEPVPMQGGVGLLVTTREVDAAGAAARGAGDRALRDAVARCEQQIRMFEGVTSTTPDFVYVFDLQGRFLYANRRLLEVWGMRLPEIVGRTCRELGYEQWHHDMHMREIAQVIATKAPIKGEVPFKAPLTGIFGVYEYIFTPVLGPDGEVEIIAGTTRDVTDRKQAEEALRRSEERLSAILEQLPVAVVVMDAEGGFILGNTALRSFGLDRMPSRDPRARVKWRADDGHGAPLPLHDWPGTRALRGEVVNPGVEFRHTGDDGREQWCVVSAVPLRHGEGGGPAGAIVVVQDITERKRAEARLRCIYDADLLGMMLWKIDGAVTDCNDRFLRMTGYAREDLKAGRIDWAEMTPREWWPDDERARQEVRDTGSHRPYEKEWIRKDGSRVPILIGAAAFDDARSEGISFALDLTDRKRAEEDLEVVTRLYAVLSRVNEAIVRVRDETALYDEVCRIVADEGRFPLVWVGLVQGRAVVPAASSGRAREYLRGIAVEVDGELGQGPGGTCIREDRPVINDDFDVNPSTRPWRAASARHGLRASAAFPLHCGGAVIGNLTLYAEKPGAFGPKQAKLLEALCADVSYALDALARERQRAEAEAALRRSEQALRDADRRKTEFLGVLSHELRNPLAPIRNSVYVLDRAPPGSEAAARARDVIRRQTGLLARMVEDLLDVTRITSGKIVLQKARLDLRDVVRKTASDHRSLFDEARIALRVDRGFAPVWVDADPTRLAQIVGNVLQNAIKFTPPGGSVEVAVTSRGDDAVLSVRDDGVGIEAPMLARVFDAFAQAEQSLARTKGGLGLGLALVKGLVEIHGGSVEARSEGIGEGTEIVIALPLAEPIAAARRTPGERAAVRPRSILVVEDNVDAGQSLADLLELGGHAVTVVRDARSGIEAARELRPDVVLCDIGLPDLDGYEVARALRRDAALRDTLLVAVTGYAQPEDRRRALDAGFAAHLAKPVDLGELARVLDEPPARPGPRRE